MSYIEFIDANKQNLLELSYHNAFNLQQGLGALYLNINNDTKQMDCSYLPIDNTVLPKNIKEEILKLRNVKKDDFYIFFAENDKTTIYPLCARDYTGGNLKIND